MPPTPNNTRARRQARRKHVRKNAYPLPPAFILLCRLWQVEPAWLLSDFIDHVSASAGALAENPMAGSLLQAYLLRMNYGSARFSPAQRQQMLQELNSLANAVPPAGTIETLSQQSRRELQAYRRWYQQWNM